MGQLGPMMHGAERKTRVPPQAINCTTAQPPTSSSAHLPRLAWSPRELDPSTGTHPPPLSAAARPARRRLHAPKRTPATMRPRGQQKRNQEQLYRGWSVAEGACSFFDRCLLRQPTRGAMHRVCPLDTLLVSSKVNERQGRVRCPEGVHTFRGSSLPGEQKRTGRNEKYRERLDVLPLYIPQHHDFGALFPHLNRHGGHRANISKRSQTLGSLGPPPLRLPRDAPTAHQISGLGAAHPTLPPASSRRHSSVPRA